MESKIDSTVKSMAFPGRQLTVYVELERLKFLLPLYNVSRNEIDALFHACGVHCREGYKID